MKSVIFAILVSIGSVAMAKEEPKKVEPAKQEQNCVKKDKNGKCPPAPNSAKPTPKKKPAETK